MDVGRSNSSGPLNAQQRYREAMADLLRRTRARVQSARHEATRQGEELKETRRAESTERRNAEVKQTRSHQSGATRPQRDRIDISDASLERIRTVLDDEGREAARPKLARLQNAYRNGTLNNPERMERAAERMLQNLPPEIASNS